MVRTNASIRTMP
jgi:hypothetical protein